MCTTQIWTYRECGCHYYHPVLCHPSFAHATSAPHQLHTGSHPSNVSSSPKRSRTPTNSSKSSSNDPLAVLCRQCSIQQIVHRNFLEPICDECLLQEMGLQPELGPISRDRDLKEGLHGEEWLLDSNAEIDIENSNDNLPLSTDCEEEDNKATDADYEGDSPGSSQRRRGIDISRDSVRISSDLPVQDQEFLAMFREEVRDAEPRSRRVSRASIQNGERRTKQRWSQQFRNSLVRKGRDDQQPTSISRPTSGLEEFPQIKSEAWPSKDHESHMKLSSSSSSEDVRDILSDTPEKIIPLCETDTEQDTHYPRWSEHLQADLEKRHTTRDHPAASMVDPETPMQCPQPPSSLHSPPETATAFNYAPWPLTSDQPLNTTSSGLDGDEQTTSLNPITTPPVPQQLNGHSHTQSADSTFSTSTFCTAPSVPDGNTTTVPASPPSTRPTTANSATTPLSLHPPSTTLRVSTSDRPSLTSRTSSLRSPPASSPLPHSTPPLHRSRTSAFVCVHERWAFEKCGCEGPILVKSCVCYSNARYYQGDEDDEDDVDARDVCRATSPIVRRRWFFNPMCETCEASEACDVAT